MPNLENKGLPKNLKSNENVGTAPKCTNKSQTSPLNVIISGKTSQQGFILNLNTFSEVNDLSLPRS